MKKTWIRTAALVVIVGGSALLVFHPLRATDSDDDVGRVRVDDPSSLREAPLVGDTAALNVGKERGWTRVAGRISEDFGTVSRQIDVRIWEGGFRVLWNGILANAGIDRVLIVRDTDGLHLLDHRLKLCPVPRVEEPAVYEIDGAPLFEPRPEEVDGLTNEEIINQLVAPAYWIRSEIEPRARSVEIVGTREIAGRRTRVVRIPMNVLPDDGRSATETVAFDEERGIALWRLREGQAPPNPGTDELAAYKQEWRFDEVAFDDEVSPLTLDDIEVDAGTSVRYLATTLSGEEFEGTTTATAGATVGSLLEELAPKDRVEDLVTSCRS